ncbi:MAG: DUF6440 family protein [Lachnospiraceae bacterium]
MGKDRRFEVILEEKGIKIISDKETKIQYLFHKDGYGGGMTVLLDKDGKPAVSE